VRVALVCPYDWSAPGGAQVHVRELADRLSELGHSVLIVAPSSRPITEADVRVVGSPIAIPYNGSRVPIDPLPWHVREVGAALRAFGPDVVHAHEPLAPNTSMWAVLASHAPVVATFHAGADRSRLFDLAAPLLRRVARRIDARIAVSDRAAAFVRARVPGEFHVIPNGIDAAAFEGAEPADLGPGRKMLFVGRLEPRKGFRIGLEAFADLAGTDDDLRLIVVGAGAEASAVESLPAPIRSRVQMLGRVPNRGLPPIHRACDLYVAPSTGGESFGVVLLEAMAARLPVVATRIPGYDEVIEDGVSGLLVPPHDPLETAAAIRRILDDGALASRLTRAAAERARRYDWRVVAAEVEDVYQAVVGGSPARRAERPPVR
jgi:phosphatidyl-myo-inositol alpha-mannosyltransferase